VGSGAVHVVVSLARAGEAISIVVAIVGWLVDGCCWLKLLENKD
jgi:hypothetical protein